MIKVERIAKPQILKNKEKEWLIAYEAALNAYKSNPTESNKLKKKTTESKYTQLKMVLGFSSILKNLNLFPIN
jgi:hypothetical protein